ncbi:MAG: chemotaxis protein CheA [gamma proteobacterium symbiont of Bathyaustriella thionipta]|nr:chemotaxis protein CheA [gamma proteobacterium symbiont of Bathyaustriella thionipta]MCU7950337.1 chemotaxis protein CheA [gamma proteobacterium symbiont of Bathyaustriella thionipta]MCU7952958.1 chemotaxis protein CheA [gamma proteobacterium symbiont of Bathyaustriella thionipta]MCU7956867.1 chemotaxis protein CheA [gamma proteobacterium symbiont of Bathyaustriella thionipta]MCU7967220.1 chemotaxis protein CheA [gamma proteobacterium symbiont of Bathyaustriella thionipta]
MSFDADDEILQDFLIEAGEIIETLNEELVELEQRPNDTDLLNSVFRSFHTIKGGAGFLSLEPLVELCHRAEDVFNLLRNGELQVDAAIMDVMLPVLDSLNEMFDNLRAATEPDPADPALLNALDGILNGDSGAAEEQELSASQEPSASHQEPSAEAPSAISEEDITDEEFEQLLDALDESAAAPAAASDKPASDEITEDEFEDLLDQLHGEGKFDSSNSKLKKAASQETKSEQKTSAGKKVADDEITDDEFENLLDELHGSGKFGSVNGGAAAQNTQSSAANEPVKEVSPVAQPAASKPETEKARPAPKPRKKPGDTSGGPSPIPAEATVRVDTKRLDDIMNMVGELVLVRNRLVTLEQSLGSEEMSKAVSSLDVVTADLQMSVMKTRMQPIKKVFGRFPRVVRDLTRAMKKEVKLELIGEDTDLDKNLVEALADPLVHLVRNSVDHGVEMPEECIAAGKERQGTVVLAAEQEGDHIMLSIEDDGAGMNADKLRKIVVKKGLMDEEAASRLDDKECYNLIFMPGFSTKDEISDISGRGVGMDVVKTRIAQLNGGIDIDSEEGKGTRIAIKVPLTLAIMPTLMVKLKDQAFALPLVSVNEIFHLDLTKTNMVDGQQVIMVRGKPLPLFYLTRWLVKGADHDELPSEGHVVVHVGTKKVGFVVNHLIGQEEVVIKPLGSLLQGTDGLAGATITGDGKIALILDIPTLMTSCAH